VDAAASLRAALRLAEGSLQGRARAALEVTPAPPVLGDAARLGQALVGLLLDAARALPAGGEAEHLVRLELAPEADGRVRIGVRVEGPATTAGPGDGAVLPGLGLDAARRAVAALGGELTLLEAGGARTVTLWLRAAPRADRLSPVGPAAAAPEEGPRGRVLVVDDEPYVGKTLRRILGQHHDVDVVSSGEAALARLAAGPAPDVILCDLMMPGMTGMALHAELVARAPTAAARMVFVTGGAVHEAARRFVEAVANPVLEKPVAPELLRRVVAESVRRGVAALPPDLLTPAI
jgi:CheY-like chemotaxis protein